MTQTYANHRRMDPAYHYGAFGLLVVCIVLAVIDLVHHRPGSFPHFLLLMVVLLVMAKTRSYALRVQDRIIRLEETLRMKAVLPEALQGEIHRLAPSQFVALRFAADDELAVRVEEALRENLGGEAIKKRIQVWKADEFRV